MIGDPNVASQQEVVSTPTEESAEDIRHKHINHEASVKSIGILYYLGAGFLIIAAIAALLSEEHDQDPLTAKLLAVAFLVGIGLIQGSIGWGLRRLHTWSRIPTIILSGIGLLAFPLGTIINGYILYLVASEKGRIVFSPQYKSVIHATPHIRYKTSIVVWIFLGILIALVALGIMAALITS
jgi:hypothetical protein